jgi:hypothetical protein
MQAVWLALGLCCLLAVHTGMYYYWNGEKIRMRWRTVEVIVCDKLEIGTLSPLE